MRIGVIGPTEREIVPFINKISYKKLSEQAMLKFYQNYYRVKNEAEYVFEQKNKTKDYFYCMQEIYNEL